MCRSADLQARFGVGGLRSIALGADGGAPASLFLFYFSLPPGGAVAPGSRLVSLGVISSVGRGTLFFLRAVGQLQRLSARGVVPAGSQ